ncbi:ankyrin repeat domain 34Bb [Narcine bancroftii]|uniref:ankyrin repeat domain 34Bb n=1 Tax=Narcine bancroftii TaxID=1343680 RepID=UPI0038310766
MMDKIMDAQTDGNSLLKAVYLSRLRLTRLLLEGGAYINESNERGETPLMIACKTKHMDQQSTSKAKMVKYLLENHADPNIQDKSGKTALMHACIEQAGVQVAASLLRSGADPSLEDSSGSSALVYAINTNDKETLKVLLDACKARGKEVIIITKDKSPSGRQITKQYLNVPPPKDNEDQNSPVPCTSPSEIELKTSPPLTHNVVEEKHVFTFRGPVHLFNDKGSSEPASPTRNSKQPRPGAKLTQLQRLHSEPWLTASPSLLSQQKTSSFQEVMNNLTAEETLSLKINGLSLPKRLFTRHQSIEVKDAAALLRSLGQASGLTASRKFSCEDIHSQSLPSGLCQSNTIPLDQDPGSIPPISVSSLRSIVQKRNLGIDHYNSDSQLTIRSKQMSTDESKSFLERKKMISSPLSVVASSRNSLDNLRAASLSNAGKRSAGILERRDSGTLLSDHVLQTRTGYLPPLKVNTPRPIADNGANTKGSLALSSAAKSLIPAVPSSQKRTEAKSKKALLRRHSVQVEQMKQLANFEEMFGQ